jgi:hypothetical protein
MLNTMSKTFLEYTQPIDPQLLKAPKDKIQVECAKAGNMRRSTPYPMLQAALYLKFKALNNSQHGVQHQPKLCFHTSHISVPIYHSYSL